MQYFRLFHFYNKNKTVIIWPGLFKNVNYITFNFYNLKTILYQVSIILRQQKANIF